MTDIEKYRDRIDKIDRHLLELLVERFSCSAEIGRLKARQGLSVLQSSRWEDITETRKSHASNMGLQTEFVEQLLELIHRESLRIQKSVITGRKDG